MKGAHDAQRTRAATMITGECMYSSSDSGRGLVKLRHAIAVALAISATTVLVFAGESTGSQFDGARRKKIG